MFDPVKVREDFPILSAQVNGRPLVYLDNAATTQAPVCMTERIVSHYRNDNANVHRGIHTLSERSTQAFESARETVQRFLGGGMDSQVIFTQGTTDAINLVSAGLSRAVGSSDSIVVTQLEHHSNLLPWQRLCAETGARLIVVPCPDGELDMQAYKRAMEQKPKLVAAAQVSNLTGTVLPLKEMAALAHEQGAIFLVDAAQGVRHEPCSVSELGCDFYCFSGHKVMGPTGIGVLWGKTSCLETLRPARVGGGMVDLVRERDFTYGPLPSRLEGGTPNYVGAIGLAEALNYLTRLGREDIAAYELSLTKYAEHALGSIEGLRILGHPAKRSGVISFTLDGIHPYDAASVLDKLGVAVRSGTHCAQPALASFGLDSAVRLSTAFYNTREEIDAACQAVTMTMGMFRTWTKS